MKAYLNEKQRKEIGFEFVLSKLDILSSYGQERLNKLSVYQDEKALIKEFDRITIVMEYLNSFKRIINESEIYLARIKNIDSIIDSVSLVCLDEVEIFEIKKFAFNITNLNNCFKKIDNIDDIFIFDDYTDLFNYLDQDGSKMPYFSLYDEYSSKLKQLRIKVKDESLNKEELEDYKRQIKEEEVNVKISITKYIAQYQAQLTKSVEQVGYLDLLIAKAKLALVYNLTSPKIGKSINLIDSYNPYVKDIVVSNGYNYIPLTIDIEMNIQLITGSNMSGKSVTLKNVLLNALCFQYGIFCFAREASLPLLDYIVYISDEIQDVKNSLSSFGKEIDVLNRSLDFIKDKNGLIILDEFASGTNPIEAKMIVVGLIKYLKRKQAYCVLSTHLDLELDIDYIHYQVVGLSNLVNTDVCEDILSIMDYSLVKVDSNTRVPNDAFKVMNMMNVNRELKDIIKNEYLKEINNEQN